MTSRPTTRRPPAVRRAEIIDAAVRVALSEGLECITLRRIGEILDVRPSLVGHYFPAIEDLVSETFGKVAEDELSTLLPPDGTLSPTQRLSGFLSTALSADFHDVNRLWLNARHLARYRPKLRDRVIVQGDHWRDRLAAVIQDGIDTGEFRPANADIVSLKILAVIDGLSADLNANPRFPDEVLRMAEDIAEDELGMRF